jgi:sulfoxide reductase heme-binding subunit YedZ
MAATDPHILWITSRAAGTTALVCASASVALGLTLGGRMITGPGRASMLRALHETLAIATVAAIVLHGATLLLDPWLEPGLAGILVPFANPYRPFFTGLGVLAAYGFIVFGAATYARSLLGDRWKLVHRFTALAWILGAVHAVGSGSDVTEPWYAALLVVCILPVLGLLAARLHEARPAGRELSGHLQAPLRESRHRSPLQNQQEAS